MYALDNVRMVRQAPADISDIPAHIQAAYNRYAESAELVSDYYPERSTAAQKRTRTIRFNKLCDLCEAANLDAPTILMRMTNR